MSSILKESLRYVESGFKSKKVNSWCLVSSPWAPICVPILMNRLCCVPVPGCLVPCPWVPISVPTLMKGCCVPSQWAFGSSSWSQICVHTLMCIKSLKVLSQVPEPQSVSLPWRRCVVYQVPECLSQVPEPHSLSLPWWRGVVCTARCRLESHRNQSFIAEMRGEEMRCPHVCDGTGNLKLQTFQGSNKPFF